MTIFTPNSFNSNADFTVVFGFEFVSFKNISKFSVLISSRAILVDLIICLPSCLLSLAYFLLYEVLGTGVG